MSHSFYSCREPFDSKQSSWVWSRGTFDPIVINGETISHTVRDLGVYIDSSINLTDHVSRLTTGTGFFKFVNFDLSVRCSLSNFRTPCAMVMTSLDYCNGLLGGKPCKVSPQSVIWRVRNAPCRTGWTFLQKLRSRFASLLTHAFMDLFHPIWYLTPVSDIPGRTFAHLRSAVVGMLKYPGLGHRLWQSDPGTFCYLLPFCMKLPPGRSSWSRI